MVTYSVTDGSYADEGGDLDGTLNESANVVVVSVCKYVCDEWPKRDCWKLERVPTEFLCTNII